MNKYNFHKNKKANKSVYDIVIEVSQIHAKKKKKEWILHTFLSPNSNLKKKMETIFGKPQPIIN